MQSFTDSPLFRTMGEKRLLFCFFDIFERQVCFFIFFIHTSGSIPIRGGGGEIDGGDGNTRRSGRNEIRERKRFLSLFRFYFPPPLSFWLSSLETSRPSTRAAADGNELERARYPAERARRELEEERERGRGSRETRGKGRNQEPRKRKKEQQKKPPM